MAQRTLAIVAALLSLGTVHAGPFQAMPEATRFGLVADLGMSPLPTTAPGLPKNIPRELMRRQSADFDDLEVPYPPAGYYCGLVDGDPKIPLTCNNAKAKCVYQNNYAGCCLSTDIKECTALATSCVNWADKCDDDCEKDDRVLKCSITTRPHCGQYVLKEETTLLGCYSVTGVTGNVTPLSDYYTSVLGSGFETLYTESQYTEPTVDSKPPTTATPTATTDGGDGDGDDATSESTDEPTATGLPGAAEPGGEGEGANDGDSENEGDGDGDGDGDGEEGDGKKKKSGVSGGAIAGIVIGAIAGVGIIAFAIWWFLMKKRKNNAASAPAPNAQQPPYSPLSQGGAGAGAAGGAAGGYYGHEAKNSVDQRQSYLPDPTKQSYQSGGAIEMPGSAVDRGSAINPSELSSASPTSAGASAAGMSATNTGPIPEQIHEIGPGR